ncbi:CRP-like cAMP-binding protein [Rhizomicrobium palustre]|uniref:CRP-like cAMP-binding protein n=1 Tax=Rhizomicrobium palustre TaxID=189966 RepID=A0A846N478_9PROT|nr:Crp/Fnr family transcriptional regulator [Rhizomicrobium palustre]NIK89897.1 CRP-like cAMP-binding protein [Rhizomicrobium palustre]
MQKLSGSARRLRFKSGDVIAQEGDPQTDIFKLVGGTLRLCRHMPGGKRVVTEFLFAGALYGLATTERYPLTLEAVGPATLIAYSKTQFERFSEGNARVRNDLMNHLSNALARTEAHLFLLASEGAAQRIASFLLRMRKEHGVAELGLEDGDRLNLPMGRKDMADHLGLTVETVCRILTALRRQNLIDLHNAHTVLLKDSAGLMALATGGVGPQNQS